MIGTAVRTLPLGCCCPAEFEGRLPIASSAPSMSAVGRQHQFAAFRCRHGEQHAGRFGVPSMISTKQCLVQA